ncbi:glycoside hydrolase family 73 protein [Flammeovirga agarivorans]|uniref:glycoside hydrolase family 73 protein n=1 Tax=Flammeovirga agarivorans TaxID=2726742 RepID=UPI001F2FB035|nr:glucosaminidase domain-containing protein [Flammeovirga agarivorans]
MRTNYVKFIVILSILFSTACQTTSQYTYQKRVERRNQKLIAENGGSNSAPSNNNSSETGGKKRKNVEDKIPPGKKLSVQEYVDMYKKYAIESMHHKKVPASITLAQGVLESGIGNSKLARATNNHFGIKCGSNWNGDTFDHDDDRPNECFRVYDSVLDSYEDHGNFLRKSRYAPLFELKITDYKGWAKGLRKCGYATDSKYPSKLISIIEQYRLYEYDRK